MSSSPKRFEIERIQTGVRMERRILKVLKALAAYKNMTLGGLLEALSCTPLTAGRHSRKKHWERRRPEEHLRTRSGRTGKPPAEGEAVNDAEFLCALEACTLPETDFGHAAHVRACYLYLKSGDFVSALARLRDAIRRYAGSLGKPQRYTRPSPWHMRH